MRSTINDPARPAGRRARAVAAVLASAGVLISWAAAPALAQSQRTENTLQLDDPSNRPSAKIEDLAWLVGTWEGEAFGGTFEETWAAPQDGTMVSTYRLMHEGATTLFEIQLLAEEEGSLVWKVKHFEPDLVAWEDKEEMTRFDLVKIEPGVAWFQGLTLRRIDEDTLQGFLVTGSDGVLSEVELTYRRKAWHRR